jgi:hypothetical protein
MRQAPVHSLPAGYHEVEHLVVTEGRRLLLLNLLALAPLLAAVALVAAWSGLVAGWRGPRPGQSLPGWAGLLAVALVLPLHEVIHAAAIHACGYRARLGVKLDKGVLYATADDAFFRRDQFIVVALAPLAVITVAGMGLVAVLPDSLGYWVGLAVALNAGGAIGDLWMVRSVRRYPPAALVRDEADGIRIFMPGKPSL